MPAFPCRECSASVDVGAERCPGCETRTPFGCAVCSRPLGAVSLSSRRSHKNPLGPFSEAGEPLCPDHRLTRCYQCEQFHPLGEMTRQVVGKREDTNLRKGMRPRIEEVFGHFCAECKTVEGKGSGRGTRRSEEHSGKSGHRHRSSGSSRSGGERSGSSDSGSVRSGSVRTGPPVTLIVLLAVCLIIPLVIFILARPG